MVAHPRDFNFRSSTFTCFSPKLQLDGPSSPRVPRSPLRRSLLASSSLPHLLGSQRPPGPPVAARLVSFHLSPAELQSSSPSSLPSLAGGNGGTASKGVRFVSSPQGSEVGIQGSPFGWRQARKPRAQNAAHEPPSTPSLLHLRESGGGRGGTPLSFYHGEVRQLP